MWIALNHARYGGIDPQPNGLSSPMVAPYGAYRTRDDQVLVLGTTNDREWQRLATQMLARPELAGDPRYASNTLRVTHRAELDEIIAAWAAGRTLAEGQAAAEAAGLGHARLNSPTDVLAHPQLSERGRWRESDRQAGPGDRTAAAAGGRRLAVADRPGPALGEHTEAILRELGYGERDIEAMRADGVTGAA